MNNAMDVFDSVYDMFMFNAQLTVSLFNIVS